MKGDRLGHLVGGDVGVVGIVAQLHLNARSLALKDVALKRRCAYPDR
jgi:hypothetical protein